MAIKTIIRSKTWDCKPVILDKNEIKQLVKYITESNLICSQIDIGEYILDNITEIDELTLEKTKYIKIEASKNENSHSRVEILFSKNSNYVKINNQSDVVLYGLFEKLTGYLKEKQSKKTFFMKSIVMLLACFGTISLIYFYHLEFPNSLWVGAISGIIGGSVISLLEKKFFFTLIYINEKKPRNFFKRNLDNILVNIFFLILGAAIGYFIQRISK